MCEKNAFANRTKDILSWKLRLYSTFNTNLIVILCRNLYMLYWWLNPLYHSNSKVYLSQNVNNKLFATTKISWTLKTLYNMYVFVKLPLSISDMFLFLPNNFIWGSNANNTQSLSIICRLCGDSGRTKSKQLIDYHAEVSEFGRMSEVWVFFACMWNVMNWVRIKFKW